MGLKEADREAAFRNTFSLISQVIWDSLRGIVIRGEISFEKICRILTCKAVADPGLPRGGTYYLANFS